MKLRTERPFYYQCVIYRGNQRVHREGCISAETELEAIDRVYEMATTVWKRQAVEVTIMDPHDGEILATSTIAEKLRGEKPSKPAAKVGLHLPAPKEEKKESGFVPWNQKHTPEFYPASVGTHFTPVRFNKLT